jgi:DNA-binding NarL/FixJ family response regulator
MSNCPLKLLLIDPDPIFRLGLRVALEAVTNLQVVNDVENYTAAIEFLENIGEHDQVNLVVLELSSRQYPNHQPLGLQFCQQLRVLYPKLPILLLSSTSEPGLLLAARVAGVGGYCPKGTPVSELVTAMGQVASGGSYWLGEMGSNLAGNVPLSGINHIENTLAAVNARLKVPGQPLLHRVMLAGHRRELLAARWLLNRLFKTPTPQQLSPIVKPPSPPSGIAVQSELFVACVAKLQFPLENITDTPLEIDILRGDKKRELLYLILQKLAQQLDEMRTYKVEFELLPNIKDTILIDLWQLAVTEFFGKFSRLQLGDRQIEIVNFLLSNSEVVKAEILAKIPLVEQLLAYLLFQTDLLIDNTRSAVGTSEAHFQASMILENLLIQVANGVIQPLLNSLADVEAIKQNYYDRRMISTREIERFRNNLSWKYWLNKHVTEAKAIFESRYDLYILVSHGIAKTSIYAPRNQGLAELSGIPLLVTLLLELQDAISPRFKSLLSFLGNGFVFLLTQVIGKGLGLIGRGILQGIGSVSSSRHK